MVAENLVFEGKKYILSRVAARLTKYSNDYIGELCRSGKIKARQIGKLWYIEKDSLLEYKSQNGKQGFGAQKIINARKETPYESPFVSSKEKLALIPPIENKIPPYYSKISHFRLHPSPFVSNDEQPVSDYSKIKIHPPKFLHDKNFGGRETFPIPVAVSKIATLVLALLISVTGHMFTSDTMELPKISRADIYKSTDQVTLSLATFSYDFKNIIHNIGKIIADFILGDLLPPPTVFVKQEVGDEFKIKIITLEDDIKKLREEKGIPITILREFSSLGVGGAKVSQQVIERIIEKTISGISQNDLNKLENSLKSEIYKLTSQSGTNASANFIAIAPMNRIDNLYGVDISGATITGSTFAGSAISVTDETVTNSLSVGGATTLSSTLSAGTTTLTNLIVTNTSTSTFAGPISNTSGNLTIAATGITNSLLLNPYGGNIGIGTTTPNWTLSVASSTPYLSLTDSDAPTNAKHWLLSAIDGIFRIGTSSDALSATSTYLTISNGGNLAIAGTGTTTIAGFLDVNGTGTNATSTFASNLWVKGTIRAGTGSIYINDSGISSADGNLILSATGPSYFANNVIFNNSTSTITNLTISNSTTTNATSTTLSTTNASTTNLVISSAGTGSTKCLQVSGTGLLSAAASACVSGSSDPNLTQTTNGSTDFYTASTTDTTNLSWYFNNGFVSNASSPLANFTGLNSTPTNATSTTSFATTASSTNLFSTTLTTGLINGQTISSAANFTGTLAVAGVSSLQGLTFTSATGTAATTTNFFSNNIFTPNLVA